MENVLLVEDAEELGELLKEELGAHGYNITWVTNGVDAVIAALDKKFDVLIVDMITPNLKGTDTIKIIKKIDPKIAIIACSGMIDKSIMIDVTKAGASACVNKPFTVSQMISQIKWATRNKGGLPSE